MLEELVLQNRSYRRFDETHRIPYDTLFNLINLARNTASSANIQPIRYKIITSQDDCNNVFNTLSWAGRLKGKGTPPEGQRPSAYIIILCDKNEKLDFHFDEGIVSQTILLGATEIGLGGCILGSIKRDKLSEIININQEEYSIDLVIALGKPIENVILTDCEKDGNIAYYRDENGNHYVPKRKTEDLII